MSCSEETAAIFGDRAAVADLVQPAGAREGSVPFIGKNGSDVAAREDDGEARDPRREGVRVRIPAIAEPVRFLRSRLQADSGGRGGATVGIEAPAP